MHGDALVKAMKSRKHDAGALSAPQCIRDAAKRFLPCLKRWKMSPCVPITLSHSLLCLTGPHFRGVCLLSIPHIMYVVDRTCLVCNVARGTLESPLWATSPSYHVS